MVRSFSWSDYFKKCFHLISKWLRDNVSDDYIQHKRYVASLNFPTKFHTYNYCDLNIRCKIKSNNKQFRGDLISWGMLKLYLVLSQCNYFLSLDNVIGKFITFMSSLPLTGIYFVCRNLKTKLTKQYGPAFDGRFLLQVVCSFNKKKIVIHELLILYYYMRNFCNLIGLEQ